MELEENLIAREKWELLELVKSTTKADLFFVRHAYPKGLGDAIYQAKSFVEEEPFVVMLGDNIIESDVPVTKQLMDLYEGNGASNITVIEVPKEDTNKYGIVAIDQAVDGFNGEVFSILDVVEKPNAKVAPSNLAVAGRYVLTLQMFDILVKQAPGKYDEVQLTDAIAKLNETQKVFAKRIEGKRYDVGNRMGYMELSL